MKNILNTYCREQQIQSKQVEYTYKINHNQYDIKVVFGDIPLSEIILEEIASKS